VPATTDATAPTPECWALHDGAAGNRRQVLALAGAMGLRPREIVLVPSRLARWLAPRRFPGAASALGGDFARALAGPAPRLALGCGRQAALATRLARERGIAVVQILDPRLPLRHWDQLVIPEHDERGGDNVVTLAGSLHPVDDAWLAHARAQDEGMAAMPAPLTAVLVGAPTAAAPWTRDELERALARIEAACEAEGGSLVLCASRRTPTSWAGSLRARFAGGRHRAWLDADDGANPYAAALARADRIVVSADSANMLSEACATRAPVYVIGAMGAHGRIGRFVHGLLAAGRALPMDAWPERGEPRPLRETARVAAELRRRLHLD
jgi:mitochondrial fission protein ELM1